MAMVWWSSSLLYVFGEMDRYCKDVFKSGHALMQDLAKLLLTAIVGNPVNMISNMGGFPECTVLPVGNRKYAWNYYKFNGIRPLR